MTSDRPTPPAELDETSRELLARLEDRDAEQLRAAGRYLEALAAWQEEHGQSGESTAGDAAADTGGEVVDADDGDDADDIDYPEGVPERASVTVSDVAGTTYYYFQWREGDRIESKTVER